MGVGNGDPSSHEPDKASNRTTFNGLVRLLVGTTFDAGKITINATCADLESSSIVLESF